MTKALLLLLVAVASLTACQSSQGVQVTQAEDVVGVWTGIADPVRNPAYLILTAAGVYSFASNPNGDHASSGEYWFEDGAFFIRDLFCSNPGKYTLTRVNGETPLLSFTVIEDDCAGRASVLTTNDAVWYGPSP